MGEEITDYRLKPHHTSEAHITTESHVTDKRITGCRPVNDRETNSSYMPLNHTLQTSESLSSWGEMLRKEEPSEQVYCTPISLSDESSNVRLIHCHLHTHSN